MNPLRLLGRVLAAPPADDPWNPPMAGNAPWPPERGGTATRAARPAAPRPPTDDPPTEPHGWAVIPGLPPVTAPPARPPIGAPGPPSPDREEAAGLAVAFAVDYLSWDEDDPARRGRVLAGYLRDPGTDPAHLGWSGRGRQRAELAAPGRINTDEAGRLVIDVRVRVTPYRSVGSPDRKQDPPVEPDAGTDAGSDAAVAPAPSGRGWRSLASRWIRLSIPVVADRGCLVIDSWNPHPGQDRRDVGDGAHPAFAPDDPLADPAAEGRG